MSVETRDCVSSWRLREPCSFYTVQYSRVGSWRPAREAFVSPRERRSRSSVGGGRGRGSAPLGQPISGVVRQANMSDVEME